MNELLARKEKKIGIIGLGYVGLPIALSFARKFSVIGFDINQSRIALMQKGIDPSNELDHHEFLGRDIQFTSSVEDLKSAHFFIVAVPTAVDDHHIPDLSALKRASETIGRVLKKGDYVVFESTVYPGCTEEDCLPIIESLSGLNVGIDFKLGYSPERINPGDKIHTIEKIVKVVAGCDEIALETIAQVYSSIVEAGIHRATSIKVAEAAKIIENTQRDLNIALMNELSLIFDKMGVNTYDVLAAAGTKWNFLRFSPGLVGGHCIGVDPYYLTYKAAKLGYASKIIAAGREINDGMGNYVAKKVIQHIIQHCQHVKAAKVLVMGATFKENVSDIRNSKVADVVKALEDYYLQVDVTDPYADSESLMAEYGFPLVKEITQVYDAVIITVPHKAYCLLDDVYFASITTVDGLVADIKGIYQHKIYTRTYWSL